MADVDPNPLSFSFKNCWPYAKTQSQNLTLNPVFNPSLIVFNTEILEILNHIYHLFGCHWNSYYLFLFLFKTCFLVSLIYLFFSLFYFSLPVDNRLPLSVEITLLGIVLLLAVIISLIIIAPHVTIAFVILLIIFVIISWIFTRSVLEIKKLDNTSRSPLISLITTSLYGLTSLYAYRKNNVFFSW